MRRTLGVLACLVAAVGLSAAPATAHDELVGTTPADGSTVDVAPDQVVLTFTEPAVALGTQVVVTGPDGSNLATGDVQLVGSTVVQALADLRPAGAYRVDWRVTSDDGHPVTGTFAFTATGSVPPPTTPLATTAAPTTVPPATAGTAPTPSVTVTALPPGTRVEASMPTTTSGTSTVVGILVLVLVVLALVVVRVGRAHSLRHIAARRAAADETTGTDGTPGGA